MYNQSIHSITLLGKLSCDLKNVDGSNSSSSSGDKEMDFKSPWEIEEELYALAVESTQVVADLLNWPDYDNTEIGAQQFGMHTHACCSSVQLSFDCVAYVEVAVGS